MSTHEVKQKYLQHLADLPLWVETRYLLSATDAQVVENPVGDGCVVWRQSDQLGAVVGHNPASVVREAAAAVPDILAFQDNIDPVRQALPHFQAESATVFRAPAQYPPPPPHACDRLWVLTRTGRLTEDSRP